MTKTIVDPATGDLLVGGKRVFPVGLSDPPPVDSVAPDSGLPAWAEIAGAGVTFARNYTVWTEAGAAEQLLAVRAELDAASAHGLQVWQALAGVDNDLFREGLLTQIVSTLKGHPGSGRGRVRTSRRTDTCPQPGAWRCTGTCAHSTPITRWC